MHECKQEADGRLFFHECRLSSIAVRFKSDCQLSSLDDTVTATQEAFGVEHPDTSSGDVVVSFPSVTGDDEGGWALSLFLRILVWV